MTPRENIYLRHTGRTTVNADDFLIWINAAIRGARHQRDLFNARGKIADEARFLEYLRKHYRAKGE